MKITLLKSKNISINHIIKEELIFHQNKLIVVKSLHIKSRKEIIEYVINKTIKF